MSNLPFLVWSDEFSVGSEKIDKQHARIVEVLNSLYTARLENKQSHVLGGILLDLRDYTRSHFTYEENILKDCDYPDYETQKKAHEALTKKTEDIIKEHKNVSGDLSMDVLQFLKKWWTNHILVMDRKYTPFLNK